MPLNVLLKPREIAYHLRDSDAKAMFCFQGTPELPMAEAAKAAVAVVPACQTLIVLPHPSIPLDPAFDDGSDVIPLARFIGGQPPVFETVRNEAGRYRRHSLYVGHDGAAQGRRADPPEHGRQRDGVGGAVRLVARRQRASCDRHHAAAVSRDGADRADARVLPSRRHARAAAALRSGSAAHGHDIGARHPLDRSADDVLDAAEVRAGNRASTCRRTAATLRLAVSGGAPMPVELMSDFEKTFGVRIIEGYGLSETSPVASFNHLDRPSKPGTVGQPLFAVDIMIVNDKDEPVETGQPGEVVIRGHNVMKGYYKQPGGDGRSHAQRLVPHRRHRHASTPTAT